MSGQPNMLPVLKNNQLPQAKLQNRGLKSLTRRLQSITELRDNNEFLPAHLEILDTPPTPLAMVFTWVICAALAAALLWSCLASIDIHAVAAGRIEPSGRSKVIQPFETSKVVGIRVENGSHVRAGDVLIELDSTEAAADLSSKRSALETSDAQIMRFKTAIASIKTNRDLGDPTFPADASREIIERERAAMHADIADYLATRGSLISQLGEKESAQKRLAATGEAREQLVNVLTERVNMRQVLVNRTIGARAQVIDSLQQLEQARADLANDRGQSVETAAAIKSIERRMDQASSTAIAKQTQSLADAVEKRNIAYQDVVKAALKLNRMRLTAPISGTVQELSVTTVGQVVVASQPLLTLVPSEGPIEINALVLNQDIGFVRPGQEAIVKIDSFPFTRYGTIDGTVLQVSRDSINDKDAANFSDAYASAKGQGANPTSATPATQNLVFPVRVELQRSSLMADGRLVQLTPGMTVSVEIKTGNRKVIDYVLSPVKETISTAGHER